jgi:hypothetical protein
VWKCVTCAPLDRLEMHFISKLWLDMILYFILYNIYILIYIVVVCTCNIYFFCLCIWYMCMSIVLYICSFNDIFVFHPFPSIFISHGYTKSG